MRSNPIRPKWNTLAVQGGELAWWEEGTGGPAILWLHGLPLDSLSWELQRRCFAPLCRNVFVDLRGYGRSSKLPVGNEAVTDVYCDDIERLIRVAELKEAAVVSFASAAHVALRLVSRGRVHIAKVVSINGSPRFHQGGKDWPFGFSENALRAFIDPLRAGNIEGVTRRILDPSQVFTDVRRADGEKIAAEFRKMSLHAGVDTLLGFFESISRDDDRALLDTISIPTLLVSSVLGKEVPHEVARYMRDRIAQSLLVEVAGADHFVFATRPVLVNELLRDFLFRRIEPACEPTKERVY